MTDTKTLWDVFDDETGKTLHFYAETLEDALKMAENTNYADHKDGAEIV